MGILLPHVMLLFTCDFKQSGSEMVHAKNQQALPLVLKKHKCMVFVCAKEVS